MTLENFTAAYLSSLCVSGDRGQGMGSSEYPVQNTQRMHYNITFVECGDIEFSTMRLGLCGIPQY